MRLAPTEEEIAWMTENIDDTLVLNIIACTVVCGVVATAAVAVRFWSRGISRGQVQLNDWLMLIAWFFYISFTSILGATTLHGGGRHIITVTDPNDQRILQILNITNECLYMTAMSFLKFSALAMYGAIFPQRLFHYCLWAVAALVFGWGVAATCASIWQCIPIEYGWDLTIEGASCIDYGLVVLVTGIVNVVSDFILLGLPIPLVMKLNLPTRKKRLLVFAFTVGGSACIISIIRLNYSLVVGSTANGSWDNIPAGILSVVELMWGIVVISLPTYAALYRKYFVGVNGSSWPSKKAGVNLSSARGTHTQNSRIVSVSAGRPTSSVHGGGIKVTDDIDMVSHVTKKTGGWSRVHEGDDMRRLNPGPGAPCPNGTYC